MLLIMNLNLTKSIINDNDYQSQYVLVNFLFIFVNRKSCLEDTGLGYRSIEKVAID